MAEYYKVRRERDDIKDEWDWAREAHNSPEGVNNINMIINRLDDHMVMKVFDFFSLKRVNGFMRLSKRMRKVAKMNKKSRGSEWGVVRRYNLYSKPTELTWPEFQNQLDSFHIEITLPSSDGTTGGFVIRPGRRKMPFETFDQHERSEAKRMEAGRRLGALPPAKKVPSDGKTESKAAIPSRAAVAAASASLKKKAHGHGGEGSDHKGEEEDDDPAMIAARVAAAEARCDALTKAIHKLGPEPTDNANERPCDPHAYEAAIRKRHVSEESQSEHHLHKHDNALIGHWITEPIVVATDGTPVTEDNRLIGGQWYDTWWQGSRWSWGNDVIASTLNSAAAMIYGGSKLTCVGDLSSRYGTVLTATVRLPPGRPIVQPEKSAAELKLIQTARSRGPWASSVYDFYAYDEYEYTRWPIYDYYLRRWYWRKPPLPPVGTVKIMPPKPELPPNSKQREWDEKCAAAKAAKEAIPVVKPPPRMIYGYDKLADHVLLSNYDVMKIVSDTRTTTSTDGTLAGERHRAQDALIVDELQGLMNKPVIPPVTPPGSRPLRGPHLRAHNRQFRRPVPSHTYTTFINRMIQQQVHREFDGDTGDRNILFGALRNAINHQGNPYSWGHRGDELGTPLERTWNDYHYNHQVVIRAPLAESTREAEVIKAHGHASWDDKIALGYRRVMRVHLLTWVFHLYDAIRHLCIQLCPEFHKKKNVKKMWLMGPDGQLMTGNVTQRTESNLKGEDFQERPLERRITDLRAWVQGSEQLRLIASFLPIYDISKEREFNTFAKNVASSDPRWQDLYDTCPCCYGW